jgi:hypothetical protein
MVLLVDSVLPSEAYLEPISDSICGHLPDYNRPGSRESGSQGGEEEDSVAEARVWVKCSICGKPIRHGGVYYACSVGSCNKRKHAFHFCSVDCWDAHRADANHRSAECVEEEVPGA